MPAGAVERNGLNGRDTDHGRFGMFQHLSHVGHVLAFAVVKASAAVTKCLADHKANQAGPFVRFWGKADMGCRMVPIISAASDPEPTWAGSKSRSAATR